MRDRESQRLFGWKYTDIKNAINSGDIGEIEAESYKDDMERVQELFPLKLSEAEPRKSGS